MDFGEIITNSAKIAWRHKGLWILGILGGCQTSAFQFFRNFPANSSGIKISERDLYRFERYLESFDWESFTLEDIDGEKLLMVGIAFVGLLLLLWLISFGIEMLGTCSLIVGFNQADIGETISLRDALSLGLKYFWRLVGIHLIVLAASFCAILIFGMIPMAIGILSLGLLSICLFPLASILMPLFFGFGICVNLSRVAVVVEDLGIRAALARTWQIFKENMGKVILMGLILIVCTALVGVIISLPLSSAELLTFLGLPLFEKGSLFIPSIFGILICFTAYYPIYLLFSGILSAFTTGAWTLTYRRLIAQKG